MNTMDPMRIVTPQGRLGCGALLALLAILAVASSARPGHAQELPIEHYTALDEVNPLPEAAVLSAYQDSLGYLWVANYGFGLLRYDGQAMEEYTGEGTPWGNWSLPCRKARMDGSGPSPTTKGWRFPKNRFRPTPQAPPFSLPIR